MKVFTNTKYISKNPISRFLIKRFHKKIKSLIIKNCRNSTIFDIGSGEGLLYKSINIENKIILLDQNKEELICAKHNLSQSEFVIGDICTLPYPNNSDSFITCFEVLEHVENYNKALEELFRITNKYCLISVPHEPFWRILNVLRGSYWKKFGNTPGHINHWNVNSFSKLLKSFNNISIKKIHRSTPWMIFLIEKHK